MSEEGLKQNNASNGANANNQNPSTSQHLDIKKMNAKLNNNANPKEMAKEEKIKKEEAEKQAKLQKAEQDKQAKLQKAEQDRQAKLLKAEEKKNKKNGNKNENMDDVDKSLLDAREAAVNEFFKTPPAGVYPKMDKQGRVIKYKKRGGVFAFFVGIFFSLFLFVFCGGLVASYFYYCYKIEDAGNTLGVNTNFLPQDTKNKTANEIVSMLLEYKDGYVNMTVSDAKEKLGLDVEQIVEKNLGIEIENFNDIELKLENVNGGNSIKVKDLRIQDIVNNSQDFIDAILPELYKQIKLSAVLDLANITINLDKPLINDDIFDLTPNPTFVLDGKTYVINFAKQVVENSATEFSTQIQNKKFTISGTEYTISDNKAKLTYAGGEIVLPHTFKRFNDLTIYDILNSIIPNYVGGESLTIGFIERALGLELINTTDPDYEALLNTNINNLKIDKLLDSVSLDAFEKLLGIDIIPRGDDRYKAILDEKLGQITASSVTENLTMGAFLDLLKVNLPDLPFLERDEFKNTTMKNIKDYVYTLKVGDFLNNIIEEVHPYNYFVKDDTNYYLDTDSKTVYTKTKINAQTNMQFAKIDEKDVYSYRINNKDYLMYDGYLYKNDSTTISSNQVTIAGVLYDYDSVNQKLVNTETSAQTLINDSIFYINNGTKLQTFGRINGTNVNYYNIKEESKVIGRIFRIKFVAGLDIGFLEDTTITYKLDKDNNIEFLNEETTIDEFNKFTMEAVEYTIGDTKVTTSDSAYDIIERSSTLQIALYALSDLTIENVINGDLSEIVSGDAKLSNLLLTDILNKEFTGLLKNLNGLTIGEIVDSPDIMIDRIKDITLSEIMGIDENSSPLLKAIVNANITIDDLMAERAPGEENPIITAMKGVTFFDLGVKNSPTYVFDENHQTEINSITYTYDSAQNKITAGADEFLITTTNGKSIVNIGGTEYRFVSDIVGDRITPKTGYNPLISILESVTIGDVMTDGGLYDIIKTISLSQITESDSGIMKILGDITFDDFGSGDVITNKLKESTANLAELLDQKIYFYDYFLIDDTIYYFVDDMETLNGLYIETTKYKINYETIGAVTKQTFDYDNNTYILDMTAGKLKNAANNQVVNYGGDVNIVNNTFVFVANKIFIISGSYVYELTKDATPYTTAANIVDSWDGNASNYEIKKASTLNKAVLSLKVGDLFNGDFTEKLTQEVKSIKLAEILGDVSGNKLLSALLDKNENVTISTLGSTINELTMGEVFGDDVDFSTGILSLISYNGDTLEDTKLIDAASAIANFDFASQKIGDLLDKGIIDFNEYSGETVTKDRNTSIKINYGNHTLVGFVKELYDTLHP